MASSPTFFGLTLVFSLAVSLISPALSLTCTSQRLMGNKLYDRCTDLSQFGSYLHWTYDSSNSSLSVAFVAPPATPNGWIAWAINPTATGMLGAQSLVAFRQSNGQMTVKTYNLSSYTAIVESKLSFDVTETSADYSQGLMRLYATIRLPANGTTTVNQVWQVGASVTNGMPVKHDFQPANLNSKGTLDLMSGQSIAAAGGDETTKKRNIHGILNVVSWGIMFPVGAIIARYLRTFKSADPAWFYLHIFCQCCSYVLGVAGWGTGLKLGSESQGVQFNDHRSIGITLFCLATVQIFALFLRPKKEHKFRSYWNIYHHGLGYSIIILGIVNVFVGLHILHPATKWRTGYTILIILLGAIAVLLEAITWIFVLRRKSGSSTKPYDGFNGQDRAQPLAS